MMRLFISDCPYELTYDTEGKPSLRNKRSGKEYGCNEETAIQFEILYRLDNIQSSLRTLEYRSRQ